MKDGIHLAMKKLLEETELTSSAPPHQDKSNGYDYQEFHEREM
jgi:hypothetical protein